MDTGPPYFGMDDDELDNSLITTSKIPGAMNYPSTTQALFALIVMIIVLLFILVYCCWGTFSCTRLEDSTNNAEDGAVVVREIQGPGGRNNRMVIVPFSNMIYVGDPESRRIYEIPVEQDKPPAYTEVYEGAPPPPYSTDRQGRNTPSTENSNNASDNRRSLPDLPPSYEDCLTTTTHDDKWPEVLEALLEQAKREREHPPSHRSAEMLVTQLPAVRMPSMLLAQNFMLNREPSISNYPQLDTPSENSIPASEDNSITTPTPAVEDEQPPTLVTDLLDPWASQGFPSTPLEVQSNSEDENPGPSSMNTTASSHLWQSDSTDSQDSVSTESVDLSSTPTTTSTTDSVSINNSNRSTDESSHSTQDYSIV